MPRAAKPSDPRSRAAKPSDRRSRTANSSDPRSRAAKSSYQRIYEVVQRIPRGRVASYGDVAQRAGLPGAARQVGYALHALPEGSPVPWQRVVNARGEIPPRASGFEVPQRRLLEREGVRFDARGRIDLARYGWGAPARAPSRSR